jgi:DNA-binding beta-propeller fold protein YncE
MSSKQTVFAIGFLLLVNAESRGTMIHWGRDPYIERGVSDSSTFDAIGFASQVGAAGIAIDRVHGKIYWVSPSEIKRADLDGLHVETVVPGLSNGRSIEIDPTGERVYWSEVGRGVRSAKLDGSDVQDLAASLTVLGVALDTAHGKIYWADTNTDRIERASLDGSNREPVVILTEGGLVGPSDLAVDPVAGRVFWAEFGLNEIRSVYFNGAVKQTLFDAADGVSSPISIDFDPWTGMVYWAQPGVGSIRRGLTDGSGTTELVFDTEPYVIAIEVEVSGDFNGDGQVSGDDLSVFREAAYFDPFSPVDLRADSSLDGVSDGADLLIWQREFKGAVTTTVPEPNSWVLPILTSLACCRGWRRLPTAPMLALADS